MFARRLLENETLQEEIAEINRLSSAHRLDDVIALTDRALQRPLDAATREFMESVRQRMREYQTIRTAVNLANQGNATAAKQALESLLASQPDLAAMQEARRVLGEIARQEQATDVDF
jgi:septum formation inhibitor-activating ATPase MinD